MRIRLSDEEKEYLYDKYGVPLGNNFRMLEEIAVKTNQRHAEVTAQCGHTLANDLRKDLGLPFNEADMNPSIYGENGDPGK